MKLRDGHEIGERWVGDALDSDSSIKGSTDFWGGPDDDLYSHGRECRRCGGRLTNRAKSNLCKPCYAGVRSTIKRGVAAVVALDRKRKAAAQSRMTNFAQL